MMDRECVWMIKIPNFFFFDAISVNRNFHLAITIFFNMKGLYMADDVFFSLIRKVINIVKKCKWKGKFWQKSGHHLNILTSINKFESEKKTKNHDDDDYQWWSHHTYQSGFFLFLRRKKFNFFFFFWVLKSIVLPPFFILCPKKRRRRRRRMYRSNEKNDFDLHHMMSLNFFLFIFCIQKMMICICIYKQENDGQVQNVFFAYWLDRLCVCVCEWTKKCVMNSIRKCKRLQFTFCTWCVMMIGNFNIIFFRVEFTFRNLSFSVWMNEMNKWIIIKLNVQIIPSANNNNRN